MILFMVACENPVGLKPVSGVEGDIVVGDALFRNLGATGLALVALDQLDQDSLGNHLLAYSDPVLYDSASTFPDDTTVHFFIQVPPPGCILVPVALTIDPKIFFLNFHTFLNDSTDLPLIYPEISGPDDLVKIRSVFIELNEITKLKEPWIIQF